MGWERRTKCLRQRRLAVCGTMKGGAASAVMAVQAERVEHTTTTKEMKAQMLMVAEEKRLMTQLPFGTVAVVGDGHERAFDSVDGFATVVVVVVASLLLLLLLLLKYLAGTVDS